MRKKLKVKKAFVGTLIRKMLGDKTIDQDNSSQYRQTFYVNDPTTGESKNIMEDFVPTKSSQQSSGLGGLLGPIFNRLSNRQSTSSIPKNNFYVKDYTSGEDINLMNKGGLLKGKPKLAKKGWK
jgi:hypothetical protein